MRPQHGVSVSAAKTQVGALLQSRPRPLDSSATRAARVRAEEVARGIGRSPLAGSAIGQAFQQYLQTRLANGQDLNELARALREKARSELVKRRHVVMCLARIAALMRGGGKEYRFRTEVAQPVRAHRITAAQAWSRTDKIAESAKPLLQMVWDDLGPPYTLGMSATLKAATGVGAQWAIGICGLRHSWGCCINQLSVSLGLSAGYDSGLQASMSLGLPASGVSWGFEVGVAGGILAHAGVSVAFVPAWKDRPENQVEWLLLPALWEFTGFSISLGTGVDFDHSYALGRTHAVMLGPADEVDYLRPDS